jgi:hypothetical protein
MAKAIRAMGTNALPVLVWMMKAQDSPLKLKLRALLQRQSLIRVPYTEAGDLHVQAAFGLCALGTNANPAVPALMDLFLEGGRRGGDTLTACALVNISPESLQACGLALTNHGVIRTNTLSRIILLSELLSHAARAKSSPERVIRIKPDGETLLPVLLVCLNDSDLQIRRMAARALILLGMGEERVVPFLAENPDDMFWFAHKIDPAATSAVPILVRALQDENGRVRASATNALKHLDLEAAAKAGVK